MRVHLQNIAKRYQKHWVFSGLNHAFESGSQTAILGRNGSGKSTLLRIIAGMQTPSVGKVLWDAATSENIFSKIAFCAPGMELPEELTLEEALRFHFTFKPLQAGFSTDAVIKTTGLESAARKPIGDYSSGMKQRVKLATAIFADTPLLLLDEPCTNLDEAGVAQYQHWLQAHSGGRTVIIASNDAREYPGISSEIVMSDYQQSQ